MRSQTTAAEEQVKCLKAQLTGDQMGFEKLVNGLYRMEADLYAKVVAVERLFDAEKARVESLTRILAIEVKIKQQ